MKACTIYSSQKNDVFNSNYQRSIKKKSGGNKETFHRAVGIVLFCFQFAAVMPVSGLRNHDCSKVEFRWASPMTLYTVLFLIALTARLLIFVYNLSVINASLGTIDTVTYYVYAEIMCIMYLALATKWPKLIQFWHKTDLIFFKDAYPPPKNKMSTKLRIAAVVSVLIVLIGTVLNVLFEEVRWDKFGAACVIGNETINLPISVSTLVRTSIWAHIFFLFIEICCGLLWSHAEVFVVIVSIGVATRFQQINARVEGMHNSITDSVWSEIRNDYIKVCELLEEIDDCLSFIILLSCTNNLCLICVQLLKVFHDQYHIIQVIFNWYAVIVLILRTMAMFLSAATINDESEGVLKTLLKIPTDAWSVEIERFLWLIKSQTVALTGMKFFHLTRKLLFEMAGTIVTYELVLLQIDQSARGDIACII